MGCSAGPDRRRACHALPAGLRTLRACMAVDETAQLPTFVRRICFEGWAPSRTPATERAFLHAVAAKPPPLDAEAAVKGMFYARPVDPAEPTGPTRRGEGRRWRPESPRRRGQAAPPFAESMAGSTPIFLSAARHFASSSPPNRISSSAGQVSQPLAWSSSSSCPGPHPA